MVLRLFCFSADCLKLLRRIVSKVDDTQMLIYNGMKVNKCAEIITIIQAEDVDCEK